MWRKHAVYCYLWAAMFFLFFFYIGKANYNLDLAIFWLEEMLDSVHEAADVIIYKWFSTGSVFSILPILNCVSKPCPLLHTPQEMLSGFVQCETELDRKENKQKGKRKWNVKKHIKRISLMSLAGSQTQSSAWHWRLIEILFKLYSLLP